MKFMGSKRSMLTNGLGETIAREVKDSSRFVDLFTGSGAVAWHVAQKYQVCVIASDLQQFSVNLAAAVLTRTQPSDQGWIAKWIERATNSVEKNKSFPAAVAIQERLSSHSIRLVSRDAQALCEGPDGGPMFAAYGGYYFSPLQALFLDSLRSSLPKSEEHAAVAVGALIQTASRCSASPGHTAQPFKPNESAGPYVVESWSRNVPKLVEEAARTLTAMHARVKGATTQGDAGDIARTLQDGDLVFVDPPYSGVHYSRFYHVLETLARGLRTEVSGTGRYPPAQSRPRSDYSISTKSEEALEDLFEGLADAGCSVIVTFPAGETSNGLSGDTVTEIADQFFRIKSAKVSSTFSTLGGNLSNRDARQSTEELILTLRP